MRLIRLSAAAALLGLSAASAGAQVITPNMIVPDGGKTGPEITDTVKLAQIREAWWKEIREALDIQAPRPGEINTVLAPADLGWMELKQRVARDQGLAFYDRYKTDPRRWEWFLATLQQQPQYVRDLYGKLTNENNGGIDTAAKNAWMVREKEIRAAFAASPQPTEAQREQLALHDVSVLRGALMDSDSRDWHPLQQAILTMAKQFPQSSYPREQALFAADDFRRSGDTATSAAFRASFKDAPNENLRLWATGVKESSVITALRTTPFEMQFTALDGRRVDLAALRGKVVLIEFTSVYHCSACRAANPYVKAAYDKYHDRGFEIITVLHDYQAEKRGVIEELKQRKVTWPHFFDGSAGHDVYSRKLGVQAVPYFLLLDQQGLVVREILGFNGTVRNLGAVLEPMLGNRPG